MAERDIVLGDPRFAYAELRYELFRLSAWTSGLHSFLSGELSTGEPSTAAQGKDHSADLRIVRAGLQRVSRSVFRVLGSGNEGILEATLREICLTSEELSELTGALRDPLMLSETLSRSDGMSQSEWQALCRLFFNRFNAVPVFAKVAAIADSGGEENLPAPLRDLILTAGKSVERDEIQSILPRFGRVLNLLDIVGGMLRNDEPLKPALLIFAKVSEQTRELIGFINHYIERTASSDDDYIGILDGASYMASMELRKVLNHELVGVIGIRPATTVYARTEAAHAMLTESFQHILTGFARRFDPSVDAFALFPDFGVKRVRSRKLRIEIYNILRLVLATEKDPTEANFNRLHDALLNYMEESLAYLFYKDTETFERFVEEIVVTSNKKDLVPILHRFGAYLETLFAQVNMRAVLEGEPFQAAEA